MTDSFTMNNKNLYVVRVQYQAYVLAESEAEAEGFAREISNTEDYPEVYAVQARGNELGWSEECCIYHNGPGDIRLGEVLPVPEVQP